MSIPEAREQLQLGRRDAGRVLTDEEFAEAIYDEPWRYELVDGRLVVMSPNSEAHDDVSEPWREALTLYKAARRDLVQKLVPEAWVKVRTGRQRIGDIGVYLHGPRSGIRRPQRAPELMFEIVSRGKRAKRRDLVEKRADYHAIEILEYVVIEADTRTVTVFSHRQEGYTGRVLRSGDTYATPLLPGLEIPLDDVF